MSNEVWAIIGAGTAIFFAIGVVGNALEKRLDRIISLLVDIKFGQRD